MKLVATLIVAAFVSLSGSGCATSKAAQQPPRPGEYDAMRLVWSDVLHQDMKDAPRVIYVEGGQLDCKGQTGKVGFLMDGICTAGATPSSEKIFVAWPPGSTFSGSGFIHEAIHAAEILHGIWNYTHTGGFHDLENVARIRLADAGL